MKTLTHISGAFFYWLIILVLVVPMSVIDLIVLIEQHLTATEGQI